MPAANDHALTAEALLTDFENVPEKWELLDGEPRLSPPTSIRHSEVSGNMLCAIKPIHI